MKVVVLGASGMLGHQLFHCLSRIRPEHEVIGTVRDLKQVPESLKRINVVRLLIDGVRVDDDESVKAALMKVRPDLVINCIGLVKQLPIAHFPIPSIQVNALFPHKLAAWCKDLNARVVQISTDCVFDGTQGQYREDDPVSAHDIYGQTKALGELNTYQHCLTVRTSIIGHELGAPHGLLEWFLAQEGPAKGYCEAYFTGLPTIELAEVLSRYVIDDEGLHGLFHVASARISKYDLLTLIRAEYGKRTHILEDHTVRIDRSLCADRFNSITGYRCPTWERLVAKMREDFIKRGG